MLGGVLGRIFKGVLLSKGALLFSVYSIIIDVIAKIIIIFAAELKNNPL